MLAAGWRYPARMSTEPDLPETRPRDLPETRPRAMHDMGGVSKFMCDAVDVERHALDDFDREVDAIRQLLGAGRVMSVDELRRGIEAIPEPDYLRLSYYQRWIRSIADNMLAKGVFTEAELAAALEDAK
jgi:hypothetical protein